MHSLSLRGKQQRQASMSQIPVEVLEDRRLLSGSLITTLDTTTSPVAALSVTATVGKKFSGNVGSWTIATGVPKPSSGVFAVAIVTWGDGKTSRAKLVDNGSGVVQIVGSHAWAKPGTFQLAVKVEEYPKGHPTQLTNIGQGDGSAVVASRSHAVSIKGTLTGAYTTPLSNPDARSYNFTGTGTAGTMGAVSITGSISPPGFIRTAPATGEFTLTTANGTVTFDVKGHTQNGGSPLPRTMSYVVSAGTGSFASASGKGTISIAVNTTASTFVIVIH